MGTNWLLNARGKGLGWIIFLCAIILPTVATGQSPEQKGYEIAARSDRSDRGFGDSIVDVKMTLYNQAGHKTSRLLQIRTLEIPDESIGDKSLLVFESPPDIRGTALLSHAKILDPDNQWLFLPALKRVKRISSVNKSGPFVGSEFSYEEFTALELNKYDYTWLRQEPCGDLQCDVVERRPRYQYSGYARQMMWVDQMFHQLRKVEFYDRRNGLLKTLVLNDYRQYDKAYWRAHQLEMVNHQTGKHTALVFSSYRFKQGFNHRNFSKSVLARLR